MNDPQGPRAAPGWITRTVAGIVLATFFSDFSHELSTSVLPLYLGSLGLGASSLGMIEGVADFLVSLSKLGGGLIGHRLRRKQPFVVLGYLVTGVATGAMGLAHTAPALLSLRVTAWVGRGFRGPLRDFLLSEEVERTHYGRAYGLERAGDMLGAVAGPLLAALLIWAGLSASRIFLWTLVPGLGAVAAVLLLVRERVADGAPGASDARAPNSSLPRPFWLFLVGVLLFGLGDFSRSFLIWIAARSLGESGGLSGGSLPIAVLLYAVHNLVSAAAAYPIGRWADRRSKVRILIGGYALGVGTNLLLAFRGGQVAGVVVAILLSGVYVAVEEVLEKASVSQLLPRELRSLGLGVLACGNAVGDMVSSLAVGFLLDRGTPLLAFGLPAAAGSLGVLWLCAVLRHVDPRLP
ncbi:MAG TPA: MFS transporter [Planctomycetota bacterium]|nr:MFS transporter [Planctomycetota bacterium]